MKVFLKIASLILCLSVMLSFPQNTFADSLYFEIVEVANNGNIITVSCQCEGNLSSKLTLICRGEDNSVLYIGEFSAPNYGYFELTFPIISNSNSQMYTLSIGGNDFDTPASKSFYLMDTLSPQYVIIGEGKTVTELKNQLRNNNPSFYRNGVILEDGDIVKTLDTISLSNGNSIVERQALVMGDIDLDGSATAVDALYALHHAIDKITLRGISYKAGDVFRNNNINAESALRILHFAVKKVDRL